MIQISNKKAISGIVATVFMIGLVMAIAAIVWVVVTNLVTEELEGAGTCMDVLDKVNINGEYTCYNYTSQEFQFSIGLGDVEIEKIVVAISLEGTTSQYEIPKETLPVPGLKFYKGTNNIKLPKKNEGFTYVAEGIESLPDSIKIYPVIGEQQCDAADTLSDIPDCTLLFA